MWQQLSAQTWHPRQPSWRCAGKEVSKLAAVLQDTPHLLGDTWEEVRVHTKMWGGPGARGRLGGQAMEAIRVSRPCGAGDQRSACLVGQRRVTSSCLQHTKYGTPSGSLTGQS